MGRDVEWDDWAAECEQPDDEPEESAPDDEPEEPDDSAENDPAADQAVEFPPLPPGYPKPLPGNNWQKVYPDPVLPGRPDAQPVQGHYARMMTAGGGWSQWNCSQVLRRSDGRIRRPRRVEFYSGEFHIEPEAAASNASFTGTVVRRCWLDGWSFTQTRSALDNPDNLGGSYVRWRDSTDRVSGSFLISLWTAVTTLTSEPSNGPPNSANPPIVVPRRGYTPEYVNLDLQLANIDRRTRRAPTHERTDAAERVAATKPGETMRAPTRIGGFADGPESKTTAKPPRSKPKPFNGIRVDTLVEIREWLEAHPEPLSLTELKRRLSAECPAVGSPRYIESALGKLKSIGEVDSKMQRIETARGDRECNVWRAVLHRPPPEPVPDPPAPVPAPSCQADGEMSELLGYWVSDEPDAADAPEYPRKAPEIPTWSSDTAVRVRARLGLPQPGTRKPRWHERQYLLSLRKSAAAGGGDPPSEARSGP